MIGFGYTADNTFIQIYTTPYSIVANSTIEWVKLEKGNSSTDWSPAPEDIEEQIQTEQQARTQAIATAKAATEAYTRTQSELTKAQAIAEANRQAGIALTAEQQARILQLQQNLQQAKTFAQQKVNELNVGGRNLILKSNNKITNNNYVIASFLLSEEPKENEQITFTLKGVLGAGKSDFRLYNKSGYQELCILQDKGNGIYQQTFNWKKDPTNPLLVVIYVFYHNVNVNSTIEWIKLEKGNKPTDWSPAPEDVENQIANINSDLEIIRKNAERIEALENQNKTNTDQRIGKLDQ